VAKVPLAEALLANLVLRRGERHRDQAMVAAGKWLAERITSTAMALPDVPDCRSRTYPAAKSFDNGGSC
jgi:hypothetical protein